EPFMAPILVTDINSAELIKHCANSFLALKISYINAVSAICEASGADVEKVADGIGMDHRIGRDFLNPGIGYGGSFFSQDLRSLVSGYRTGDNPPARRSACGCLRPERNAKGTRHKGDRRCRICFVGPRSSERCRSAGHRYRME